MPLPLLPGSRSTAWVLAETAASALFSLGSLLLIGRVIGPEQAGIGAIVVAAFLLLDVLGAALFTDALVQRAGLTPRQARSALTGAALVGLAAGLVLAGGAPLLGAGAGHEVLPLLALALAPLLPVSAFCGAASGLAIRDQRYRLLALRVLVGQPLALAAGLWAAADGLGAWAMVINQAVATLSVLALFLAFGRVPLRPALHRSDLAALWPVAGPQIAAVTLMVGRYRIFVIALGLLLTEAVLAQAHVAFRMLDAVVWVAWGALARIAMPRLCALQHDREALARSYGQLAQLPPLLGLPLALGVALVAEDLVAVLLGPAWADAASAARIAALAMAVTFFHGDHFSLFVALGQARRNLAVAVAGLALPLLALAVLQPQTAAGAALAWAGQSLLVTPVLFWIVLRELRRPPGWLLKQALPGLAGAVAMVAVVLGVQAAMAELAPAARLAGSVSAGAAAFVGVAWLALGRRLPEALRGARGAAPPPLARPARAG